MPKRVVCSGKLGPILRPLFGRTMALVLGQFFLFVDQYLARFQIYDFLLVEVLILVDYASFVYQAAGIMPRLGTKELIVP
jgi:hypothetical protein